MAALDFVGSGQTVDLAIAAAANGGSMVALGLYGGVLTLRESYVGNPAGLAELLALVNDKGMPAVPIGTRPLDEAGAALADLCAGRVVGRLVPAG